MSPYDINEYRRRAEEYQRNLDDTPAWVAPIWFVAALVMVVSVLMAEVYYLPLADGKTPATECPR